MGKPLRSKLGNIFEVSETTGRIVPMEGLRGAAVLLVFFVHFNEGFKAYARPGSITAMLLDALAKIGHSGVDLFFVISGYLIYGALIRKREFSYFPFVRRRATRIYPTFLAVLGVYLALSVLLPQQSRFPQGVSASMVYLGQNLLLLPGLFSIMPIMTVSWSLSFEFFFYLTLPILLFLARMRLLSVKIRLFFWCGIAVVYVVTCGIFYTGTRPLTMIGGAFNLRLVMFVSGIVCYELLNNTRLKGRLGSGVECLVALALVCTLVLVCLIRQQHISGNLFPGIVRVPMLYEIGLLWPTFSMLILLAFGRPGFLANIFSFTPLRWLGNMSYSYYLVHGITINAAAFVLSLLVSPAADSDLLIWAMGPVVFAATLTTSAILFILVEKRFSLGNTGAGSRRTPGGQAAVVTAPHPVLVYAVEPVADNSNPFSAIRPQSLTISASTPLPLFGARFSMRGEIPDDPHPIFSIPYGGRGRL